VPVPVRRPFAGAALLGFLLRHTVPGVETGTDRAAGKTRELSYARTLRLPHGPGLLRLTWAADRLSAEFDADPRDHDTVLTGLAHLVDADADAEAVDAHLARDPRLRPLVAATPGLRVPGTLDAAELVVRTLIVQQISLDAARTCAATITRRHGEQVERGDPALGWLFPSVQALAAVDPTTLPMPRSRGRTLVAVAAQLADGRLDLSGARSPAEVRTQLLACPGIGPWTADYVLMRVRHVPDVLLGSDLVIRRQLRARGITDTDSWAPYRSYATMHLWHDFLERSGGAE
jgi:AraC family transcriptional regulator, regulatory protein of adaptative response / DNA-3-methyladenine glycosylase II